MGRARGEEVRLRRGGEEREAGGSDMAEVREQGGGAKGGERKDGEREGFAISVSEPRCCLLYGLYLGLLGFPATRSLCLLLEMCCLSWTSEFTWTSQIWQWKVLFCRPEPFGAEPPPFLGLVPARGKALIGPAPLRASSIVLCFEPAL